MQATIDGIRNAAATRCREVAFASVATGVGEPCLVCWDHYHAMLFSDGQFLFRPRPSSISPVNGTSKCQLARSMEGEAVLTGSLLA